MSHPTKKELARAFKRLDARIPMTPYAVSLREFYATPIAERGRLWRHFGRTKEQQFTGDVHMIVNVVVPDMRDNHKILQGLVIDPIVRKWGTCTVAEAVSYVQSPAPSTRLSIPTNVRVVSCGIFMQRAGGATPAISEDIVKTWFFELVDKIREAWGGSDRAIYFEIISGTPYLSTARGVDQGQPQVTKPRTLSISDVALPPQGTV